MQPIIIHHSFFSFRRIPLRFISANGRISPGWSFTFSFHLSFYFIYLSQSRHVEISLSSCWTCLRLVKKPSFRKGSGSEDVDILLTLSWRRNSSVLLFFEVGVVVVVVFVVDLWDDLLLLWRWIDKALHLSLIHIWRCRRRLRCRSRWSPYH